jgi:hypothetical protein
VEPNETVLVNLTAPVNATIADAQAVVTLVNDDTPSISIADLSLNEGNAGTTNVVVTLTLSAASASTVTVNYATANGTATAGSDYTAASGTATFTAGATSTTISIPVTGDTTVEPNETILVNLTAPVNATIADAQAVVTLFNDEAAGPSPDGTTVPPAAQIIDSSGAVWTIGANQTILRDGVQPGNGFGSKILWRNSTIYVLGTDSNWWQWTESGWINVGPDEPGGGGGVSPNGTTVPPAAQIIDSSGAVWTIGANQTILRNGSQAAGGLGSQILWTSGTIYVLGNDNDWYQWTGSGWINVGPAQPGGGGSPNGTMVPPATQIVDNLGAVWTIGANQTILRNGTHAVGGFGSKILWTSNRIYVLGSDSNWWQWTGAGWISVGPTQPS